MTVRRKVETVATWITILNVFLNFFEVTKRYFWLFEKAKKKRKAEKEFNYHFGFAPRK